MPSKLPRPLAVVEPAMGTSRASYRTSALVTAMALAALLSQQRIPGVPFGLHLVLLPPLGLLGLWWARAHLRTTLQAHRAICSAMIFLTIVGLAAALASPVRALALQGWAKYCLLGGIVFVFLALHRRSAAEWAEWTEPSRPTTSDGTRLYIAWIVAAALVGLAEMIWPEAPIFRALRDDQARSIQPRVAGLFLWPNQYAALLVAALTCLATRRTLPRWSSWWLLPLLTLQLAATGSRSAWLLTTLICLWLTSRRHASRSRCLTILALLAAWCLTVPVAARQLGLQGPWLPLFPQSEVARAGPPHSGDAGRSVSGRFVLWRAAVETYVEHPVLGIGPDAFEPLVGQAVVGRRGFNAHSLPLNVAAETGSAGLLACLLLILAWAGASSGSRPGPVVAVCCLLLMQGADCFLYDFGFLVWGAWLATCPPAQMAWRAGAIEDGRTP